MRTVLIAFADRQSKRFTATVPQEKIDEALSFVGDLIKWRYASNEHNAPLMITGYGDEGVEDLIQDYLTGEYTDPVAPVYHEPDPREVNAIDDRGTGISGELIPNGAWAFKAFFIGRPIYLAEVITGSECENVLNELSGQISELNRLLNFIRSISDKFTPADNALVSPVGQEQVDLPDFTAPINKKAAMERMGRLLGNSTDKVEQLPEALAQRPGTFLVSKEEPGSPCLQIVAVGDGELLKDMGFLALLLRKYPDDIKVIGEDGHIRRVTFSQRIAQSGYMVALRSILVDANLTDKYTLESKSWEGVNVNLSNYMLL